VTGRQRKDYGPIQLAEFLGLETWQFSRARAAGLIPAPDRARGRWSAETAQTVLGRIDQAMRIAGIIPGVDQIPDLGAIRASEVLSARLGATVTPAGVIELARRDLIPEAGSFRGWPLYSGLAIEAFTDGRLAEEASRAGELRTAGNAASYLNIRRTDFGHLTRLGLVRPADWCQPRVKGAVLQGAHCFPSI
jgi:hypothetical protein